MQLARFNELYEQSDSNREWILAVAEELEPYSKEFECAISLIARTPFDDLGVGKATVRSAIVDCFDVSSDYLSLLESEHGDLPTCAKQARKRTQRLVPDKELTLRKLYIALEDVDSGDFDASDHLKDLLGTYSHPEWIVHAFLGKNGMSFGVGPKTIVNVLEKEYGPYDTRRGRALCPDIRDHANRAVDPNSNVPQSVELGQPFLPMLAKSKDIPTDPGNDEWVIQPKYDGARILVHIEDGDVIAAFSRNTNEVTDSLPELDRLEDIFETGDWILDGEAIAYKNGEPQPFQKIMTRFNRTEDIDEQEIDVRFKFFDMVYADAKMEKQLSGDISRKPFEFRSHWLWYCFGPHAQTWVAPTYGCHDEDEITAHFQRFRENGLEGAILKNTDAKYEFDRRSPHWRKMIENMENVDLRIVDVIEGEDNQAGKVGALELETQDGHIVGKVGTGFGSETADDLWERRHEIVGQIVELSWREIQENDDGTYGIRFPAFEGLRTDKIEADTLDWMLDQ